MTSCEVTFNTTGRPTGMCSSLAVRKRWLGIAASYSASHHHWWPIRLITTAASWRGDAIARPVNTVATSSTNKITTVAPTASVTPTFNPASCGFGSSRPPCSTIAWRSAPPTGSDPRPASDRVWVFTRISVEASGCNLISDRCSDQTRHRRRPRSTATARTAIVKTNTAATTQNCSHQSRSMFAACGPAACSADCATAAFSISLHRRRRDAGILRHQARRRRFGRLAAHVIAAVRRDVLGREAAHRSDIRRDLPDLRVRDLPAPRRHAVGAPFENRPVNLIGLVAVRPFVVNQRRAHAAAAVGVAAAAVVGAEQTLPFVERVGVLLVGVDGPLRRVAAARMEVADRDVAGHRRRRNLTEAALLAFAGRQREDEQQRNSGAPHDLTLGMPYSSSRRSISGRRRSST